MVQGKWLMQILDMWVVLLEKLTSMLARYYSISCMEITIFQVKHTVNLTCIWILLQTVVKRGIAMEHATDALIQLIKDHGRWVDPPTEE